MVMGPTHAVSGTAAWLVASAVGEFAFGIHQSAASIAVGTIACTGAALLPDLDCSGRVLQNKGGATVARTFGVASLFLAECVEKGALGIHKLTRTKKDKKRNHGHRTFTHTWLFAILLGLGTAALVGNFGKPAVIGVMFFLTGLAIRGIMNDWARQQGWWVITLLSLAAAFGFHQLLPGNQSYTLLGVAVGIGCVVHTLGDMITKMGCPVFFPIPIKKKLWTEFGLPKKIAIKAGSPIEKNILMPAFTTIAVVSMILLLPEVQLMMAAAFAE
ncbi:metal-dependent hydrolase [Stackebrandtia soli]|uniref:metal-dependent hydrolase n=1 Tax=Stackebrandtia soli TaxID=1892856 RepID=UPI0039EC3D7E